MTTDSDYGDLVRKKVDAHADAVKVDAGIRQERTSRFMQDVAPVLTALKQIADAGARNGQGRLLGWQIDHISDDPEQRAFFDQGGYYRPIQLRVGFLDDAGKVVDTVCVLMRTVNNRGLHKADDREATVMSLKRDRPFFNFVENNNRNCREISAPEGDYGKHRLVEKKDKDGYPDKVSWLSSVVIPNQWLGKVTPWVTRTVMDYIDPKKTMDAKTNTSLAMDKAAHEDKEEKVLAWRRGVAEKNSADVEKDNSVLGWLKSKF